MDGRWQIPTSKSLTAGRVIRSVGHGGKQRPKLHCFLIQAHSRQSQASKLFFCNAPKARKHKSGASALASQKKEKSPSRRPVFFYLAIASSFAAASRHQNGAAAPSVPSSLLVIGLHPGPNHSFTSHVSFFSAPSALAPHSVVWVAHLPTLPAFACLIRARGCLLELG